MTFQLFPWASSHGSDFNLDDQASVTPEQVAEGEAYDDDEVVQNTLGDEVGISVFFQEGRGVVFHTHSCHARGVGMLGGAYHYLDLVPEGRDEGGLEIPMEWVRRHDQYR